MRTRVLFPVLCLALAFGLLAAVPGGAAEKKADPARIAELIKNLGSSNFTDREKAQEELDAIGVPALEALKKATKSDDAEVRKRAEELVKKYEKIAETERLLKPTMLRLTFKDTPLKDAIAEVTKTTGLTIVLADPQNKLGDRKVTLDTGETTLWKAFDAFCEAAGLVEAAPGTVVPGGPQPAIDRPVPLPPRKAIPGKAIPAPAVPVPAAPAVPAKGGAAFGVGGAFQVAPPAGPGGPAIAPGIALPGRPFPGAGYNPAGQITLVDGKPAKEPVDYAGAIRIKGLPPGTPLPFPKQNNEVLVGIQLTPEPKLALQSLLAVQIEKAVDNHDQALTQILGPQANNGAVEDVVVAGPAVRLIAKPGYFPVGGVNQMPIRLKKGEKETKSLKELKGMVTGQIRTAPEAIITVDKLAKAAGTTTKGVDSQGSIKVSDFTKGEDGTWTLKFQFEMPADVIPAQPKNVPVKGGGKVIGGVIGGGKMPVFPGGYNGLTVEDDKGNVIPMGWAQPPQVDQKGGTAVWDFSWTLQPEKGQGEPAKVVFAGSKLVTVDIPFTLKDVPVQ